MLLFALVRAVHLASLMILTGAGAFAWLAKTRLRIELALPRSLPIACGALALATGILLVGFAAGEMTGTGFAVAAMGRVLAGTLYGHVAVLRMALLAATLLFAAARPRASDIAGAVGGGIALTLLGLTSHAAAGGAPQFALLRAGVDAAHLLTAGLWTGGLVALLVAVFGEAGDSQRHIALLRLFSRWGVGSVAVLAVAGTINALAILDVPGMRWSLAYVSLLAAKLVLAAVMIALALTNRFGVLPGLARGEREAAETLPLTLSAELAGAILIVVIVGFLGLTAPMQM